MSLTTNTTRGELLLESLQKFLSQENRLNQILPIINGESKISLRVIDWFVTNYSKKYNTSYFIDVNTNKIIENLNNYDGKNFREFVVYLDYKLQLKGYSKKQFDPFCRRSRINFKYNENESFVTTVGQMNFFRWVINNNIIDYIDLNLKNIEKDMNMCYKNQYDVPFETNKDGKSLRRKRKELSISASKHLSKTNVKIILSFD